MGDLRERASRRKALDSTRLRPVRAPGRHAVQGVPWRPGGVRTAEQVLALQRQAGNVAVAEMVAPQADSARPMLRQGSQGEDVRDLQNMLNQKDEVKTVLAIDGAFGPLTDAAVREFQTAHPPLVADAIVGPLTWGQLEGEQAAPQDDAEMGRKLFNAGAAAFSKGDYAHAYDFLTRAGEIYPKPAITFSRAQCLRRLGGRRPEAIALFEQYLAEAPDGTRVVDATAALVELRGPAKTGDEETDKAAAKALFDRGAALFGAGQYGHAYDELTKAGELYPKPAITFSRAQCLRRLGGRRPEAIALFEQYLAEAPDGSRVADATAALVELRGPAKTGDEETDKAAAKVLFDKGAALFGAGQYAHAYDELTKAGELYPKPAITFSRAQCLRKLGGRRDEAIALFEQYLADAPDGTRVGEARLWADALRTQGAAP